MLFTNTAIHCATNARAKHNATENEHEDNESQRLTAGFSLHPPVCDFSQSPAKLSYIIEVLNQSALGLPFTLQYFEMHIRWSLVPIIVYSHTNPLILHTYQ